MTQPYGIEGWPSADPERQRLMEELLDAVSRMSTEEIEALGQRILRSIVINQVNALNPDEEHST